MFPDLTKCSLDLIFLQNYFRIKLEQNADCNQAAPLTIIFITRTWGVQKLSLAINNSLTRWTATMSRVEAVVCKNFNIN